LFWSAEEGRLVPLLATFFAYLGKSEFSTRRLDLLPDSRLTTTLNFERCASPYRVCNPLSLLMVVFYMQQFLLL
jgi:hypothetical protein